MEKFHVSDESSVDEKQEQYMEQLAIDDLMVFQGQQAGTEIYICRDYRYHRDK